MKQVNIKNKQFKKLEKIAKKLRKKSGYKIITSERIIEYLIDDYIKQDYIK